MYDSVSGDIVFVFAVLHMFMRLTELFVHVFWSCMCHAYDSDEGALTILWADQENKMAN